MHDSSFGRLLGVLMAPGKTFRSVAERPTWVVPLLVLTVLGSLTTFLVMQRVDQEEMVRYQMSQFGRELSEDQIQQQVEMAEKTRPVQQVLGPIFIIVIFLILAVVFWVAFKLLGSEMDFRSSLATALYGLVPAFGIGSLLGILIILGRDSITPEEMMSGGGVLMSNAAAFAPEDASPFVESLLGSLDVFSIWSLILLTIGYSIVARVSTKAAGITVVVLWLLYVLGKSGFAAAIGSLAGGAGA